jgi:hypothetical protein
MNDMIKISFWDNYRDRLERLESITGEIGGNFGNEFVRIMLFIPNWKYVTNNWLKLKINYIRYSNQIEYDYNNHLGIEAFDWNHSDLVA